MTNWQFWVQTAVQIVVAAATLLLAVIAIWGESLRAKWVGPKLRLELIDSLGEFIRLNDGSSSRYYHMRVTNERRAVKANNVRVVLTEVSRSSADQSIRPNVLSGPIQLEWQHGHSLPQFPALGPPLNCVLGRIVKGQAFRLLTLFDVSYLNLTASKDKKLIIEAIALSDETESNSVRVEIDWDGDWSDDTTEMSKHLVVKTV